MLFRQDVRGWAGACLAMTVLVLTACETQSSLQAPNPPNLSVALADSNEVRVLVLGRGRYIIGGNKDVTSEAALEAALRAAAGAITSETKGVVLFVHRDLAQKERGYQALIALDAASRAGFTDARGIDNYSENPNEEAREAQRELPRIDLVERLRQIRSNATPDSTKVGGH